MQPVFVALSLAFLQTGKDCCTLLGAAGTAQEFHPVSFGEMTAAKKNLEKSIHSIKQIFLNAAFPILLAQGMLWTSLFNTHRSQIISAHLTWMQARVWVFFPVQLLLPLPEKAGKSCYPVCWTLIISCGSSSQSWYVGPRSTKKWEHFLGIKSHSIFFPLWLGGLKQQHQWHNERSCYSPVQGHFPIPHEEQKALETN